MLSKKQTMPLLDAEDKSTATFTFYMQFFIKPLATGIRPPLPPTRIFFKKYFLFPASKSATILSATMLTDAF